MALFPPRTALDRVGKAAAGLLHADSALAEIVDDPLEMLQVLGVNFARMDPEDAAVAGREDREGQGVDVDAEGGGSGPRLGLTDEDRIVELHVAGELRHELRLVDRDTDDLQIGPRRLELLEHRDLA